jgi:uncharacterized protein (DUF885 family)
MNRRDFIAGSAAGALATTALPVAAQGTGGDARLTAAFDAVLAAQVAASPETATSLGLDKGAQAGLRSQLDPNDAGDIQRGLARARAAEARIKAVDPTTLSPSARLDREVVLYSIAQQQVAPARFGIGSATAPYRIDQQHGSYARLPDFLDATHPVATATDADAYLARLSQMPRALDNDTAVQRAEAARGLVAPGFLLDLALGQMAKLREPAPAANPLVLSLDRRARAAGLGDGYATRAATIVEREVYPALDRQIALVGQLRTSARTQAGLGAVPNGDAIYAAALASATTTTMTPAEVHRFGLDQVAELSARLDPILKAQGLSQGGIGARLARFNTSPGQLYPDTAAGRADLIAGLNTGIRGMYAKLPQAFSNPPHAPLDIRAVPAAIQDGASNGYYYRAPLDGSRPAIYWINLKSIADWPKYTLPSLTYHEGIPGHHLQISTAQRAPVHTLRKITFFGAYIEGWGLYAEQLAGELGGYATPVEQAGYIQSFLFRSARLVVDTGIHTMGWSRDQATDYFVEHVGFTRARSQREVERYCSMPGQACSYKIGHRSWVRARDAAKATLGTRFDLKRFHDILEAGPMPLSILEEQIAARAKAMA